MLVMITGLVSKGLFIKIVMQVGINELKREFNYWNQATNQELLLCLVLLDPVLRFNKFCCPKCV